MKDKSNNRHYRLVTVKIKLGLINSFRPGYVSSLAWHCCLYFPCSQGRENFISISAATEAGPAGWLALTFNSKGSHGDESMLAPSLSHPRELLKDEEG